MHVLSLSPDAHLKTDANHLHRAENCLNCGTAVSANYCPNCGQETVLHVPSAGEFLHEFIGHYVALEGKLWKSLGLLMFRPGRLTRDYLDGKRARYVLPLRLYLTFSIIFFAVIKLNVNDVGAGRKDREQAAQQQAVAAQQEKPAAPAPAEPETDEAKKERDARSLIRIDAKDREVGGILVEAAPQPVKEKVKRLKDMSTDEVVKLLKGAFFSYAPYIVFALMPVFALYLKLLYLGSGRRYGEHLLFALHTNAFAYLVLSLMVLIPASVPFIHGALGLWLVFYLPTAMRKVYGGGRMTTFARWIVLGLAHLFTLTLGIIGALGLGVALS